MPAGIIGGTLVLVGLVLIGIGTYLSIADWNADRRPTAPPGTFETTPTSAADVLAGLAKVFEALRDYPIGRFMIAIGFAMVVLGAIISTAGALAA